MRHHPKRIGLRMPETLYNDLQQFGDQSAVARALLIVGLAQIGQPITHLRDELDALTRSFIHDRLKSRLRAIIVRLDDEMRQSNLFPLIAEASAAVQPRFNHGSTAGDERVYRIRLRYLIIPR